MILIGIGANLPSEFGSPAETLQAALKMLVGEGISIRKTSGFYESEPVPKSAQPWFVNAVARLEFTAGAPDLHRVLLDVEKRAGRTRHLRWEARVLDLDLLAYNDLVLPDMQRWRDIDAEGATCDLIVPHPRAHLRRFVLEPLVEIEPGWRHPVFGATARELFDQLDANEIVRKLDDSAI